MTVTLHIGDCRDVLRTMPDESVHCIVTSPPYWGLRDYGTAQWEGGDPACEHKPDQKPRKFTNGRGEGVGDDYAGSNLTSWTTRDATPVNPCPKCGARRIDSQIGLERSLGEYVETMVAVFRDVRRVLRKDGTLWLNMGDTYASTPVGSWNGGGKEFARPSHQSSIATGRKFSTISDGLKPKDLCGIPWRVAFALQEDGWWLRQDIVWAKPNPMPESVTDRCTKAHEYLFLLTKAANYYYDADAIRETTGNEANPQEYATADGRRHFHEHDAERGMMQSNPAFRPLTHPAGRNKRSVWEIATAPFSEAHFATFPPALIEPCIKAGTSEKGCCAKCGKPWRRQILATAPDGRTAVLNGRASVGEDGRPLIGDNMIDPGVRGSFTATRGVLSKETLGWSPSCACNAEVVPCTVLDCFAGAGTTGLVADRLGRNAILIELNPQYADMTARRIRDDAGMFAQVSVCP